MIKTYQHLAKSIGLSISINIFLFSFLPILHYIFHESPSKTKPIQVEVVKLKTDKLKIRKTSLAKAKIEKIAKPRIKYEFSRRIGFELDPYASINEADLSASGVIYDLSEIDQIPRILKYIQPDYPEEAKLKGIEGKVTLKILINCEGKVERAEVLNDGGFNEFGRSAVRTIIKWEFEPARIMDMPVAVWCIQAVYFELK